MKASELNDALNALWPELNRERTVDRIVAGPDQEVRRVAVCWMPYSWALRRAAEMGAGVVVAHEPTFFEHMEHKGEPAPAHMRGAVAEKKALIESLGLTIIRCHDMWDALPEFGVPFQWGRFLGLGEPVKSVRYLNLHESPVKTAGEFASWTAGRTEALGQAAAGFYGDPDREVKLIGIGTGCCSRPEDLFALGADLAVSADDIVRSWIAGEWAADTGRPIVVVNHGVAEACSMPALAEVIRSLAPGVPVEVIPQGCSFREFRAPGSQPAKGTEA